MIFNVTLGIFFFLSLLFDMICMGKLLGVKRQLQNMTDALNDMEAGNGNRRILAVDNELTADFSYKINEIVTRYEERISELRAADETNRQLMTSLSHDVRTPLTTLIGYLEAVHRGVATGKEREDYLKIVRRKAHDLKDYIDLLFDWFKLNSGEFSLSIERVELAELTRNILKDWIPIFEENHLNYEIEIPERALLAKVDLDGYARILNNLVQNVIAHSRATQIKIEMVQNEKEIEIHIADNGIGIEKADLPHIFKRLYKCDKGRSDKGSRLGLSIVGQMAEKMEGRINVRSEPNQYTVFTVCFPVKK